MDKRGQQAIDRLFELFIFFILFLVLLVPFFSILDALSNTIANIVLGSTNIEQTGSIVLIVALMGIIFLSLGLAVGVKIFTERRREGLGGV